MGAIVYAIINNKTGKRYIGVTERDLSRRWIEHLSCARRGGIPGRLFKAIRKHGAAAFSVVEIARFETRQEALDEERRIVFQERPDYNSAPGGGGAGALTEDGRRRISEASKLRKPMLGARLSAETRNKIRVAQNDPKIKAAWAEMQRLGPQASQRQVRCINTGTVFESASAAARYYGTSRSALIELCLGKNGRKTVGGLKFEYVVQ